MTVASLPSTGGTRRLNLPPAFWRGTLSVVGALILWELAARYVIANPLFFTPLTTVFDKGVALAASGELQVHIWTSFIEFALGFLLASVVGVAVGIWMASSRVVSDFLDPWVSMLYATPIIALGPLFILWFGLGIASKVAVIFLTAVFPVLINTETGLKNADQRLVEVARSFGATPAQIYRKVRFPGALPYIVAGLRLAMARALVGVVVAELFGAKAGLGFLIFTATQTFDTAGLFVGVFILAIFGVILNEALKLLERRLAPWRFQPEGE